MTTKKKQELIQQLSSDVDKVYEKWKNIMIEYFNKHGVLFYVYAKKNVSEIGIKWGVLECWVHLNFVMFYVHEGRIGIQERYNGALVSDSMDVDEIPLRHYKWWMAYESIKETLRFFVETHPELQD